MNPAPFASLTWTVAAPAYIAAIELRRPGHAPVVAHASPAAPATTVRAALSSSSGQGAAE